MSSSLGQSPSTGPVSLAGSTVLVFGGRYSSHVALPISSYWNNFRLLCYDSSGIGKAVAVGASAQGAREVFIVGRDLSKLAEAKKEIEAAAPSVCVVHTASVDVMDEKAVRSFVNSLPDNSIDHLVTTPGSSAKLGNLIKNKRSCDDVRKQFDMKVTDHACFTIQFGSRCH